MISSRLHAHSHRLPRCVRLRHYYGGRPAIACAIAAARASSWGMRSSRGSSSASCKTACRSGATLAWEELTVSGGRVRGGVLLIKGERKQVTARRGVVLATGGFGGSVDRLNKYLRPPLAHAVAFSGATGDGMRLACAVGAEVEEDHASPAFLTPVSDTRWL